MNKKTLIPILLVLGVVAFIIVMKSTGYLATVSNGMQIKSVSQVPNVVTGNENLANLNWLVTANIGGSDSVLFSNTFSGNNAAGTKVETVKPFELQINGMTETLKYDIVQQTNANYFTFTVSPVMDISVDCRTPGRFAYYEFVYNGFTHKHFCVNKILKGRYGQLTNPATGYSATVTVGDGTTTLPPQQITNQQSIIMFKDNYGQSLVTVRANGALLTGNPLPTLPQNAVINEATGSQWNLIPNGNWGQFIALQDAFETNLRDEWNKNGDTSLISGEDINSVQSRLSGKIHDFEIYAMPLITENFVNPSNIAYVSRTSKTGAYLTFNPDAQLTVQEISMWVRADYLGIKRYTTKPVIKSATSTSFSKLGQGNINIVVSNSGEAGAAIVSLGSCTNFQQVGSLKPSLNVGDNSVVMPIYTDLRNVDKTENCDVCVQDFNDATIRNCKSVSMVFKASTICLANHYDKNATSRQIIRCNAAGTAWDLVANCPVGFVPQFTARDMSVNEGFECVDENHPTPTPTVNPSQTPGTIQCNDGKDNDNDGKTDFPSDPGCAALNDLTEADGGNPTNWTLIAIVGAVAVVGVAVVGMYIKRK